MDIKSLYREIVNEHNIHPAHKHPLDSPTMVLNGVNPSCGDDIDLQLKVDAGVITDASFTGSGCAISQASADMMCDLVIGRNVSETKALCGVFMAMIRGTATDEQKEMLDEAASLEDISHMPARVKCATLGWRTMGEILDKLEAEDLTQGTVSGEGSASCGACGQTDCIRKK